MNRREFIVGSIILAFSSSILSETKKHRKIDIYIDESGDVGTRRSFVIGALVVESDYDYQRISNIRKNSGFKQILKYSSSNKFKKNLSAPLIDEFFSNRKMRFRAIAFPETVNVTWPSRKRLRTELYNHNYVNFVDFSIAPNVEVNLYLERRAQSGEDRYLKDFMEKRLKNVKISFIKEKESDLLQLSDLFTGSIFGEINSVRNRTKKSIISHLKAVMNTTSLSEDIDYDDGKFKLDIRNKV